MHQAGLLRYLTFLVAMLALVGCNDEDDDQIELDAVSVSHDSVELRWEDPEAPHGGYYDVYVNDDHRGSLSGTSGIFSGLEPSTRYCLFIAPRRWRLSATGTWQRVTSNKVCIKTRPGPQGPDPDDTFLLEHFPPPPPQELEATSDTVAGTMQIMLTWKPASGDDDAHHYEIYRNGNYRGYTLDRRFVDTALEAGKGYCYEIVAISPFGVKSAPGDQACATASWSSVTVGDGGFRPAVSLVVDSMGVSQIAYQFVVEQMASNSPVDLIHTDNRSGDWADKMRLAQGPGDDGGTALWPVSLAADAGASLHIAHHHVRQSHGGGEPGISYVNNLAAVWETTIPGFATGRVDSVDLKVDAANAVHLCWGHAGKLVYATNQSGAWNSEEPALFSAAVWPVNCALALDSLGKVHISFTRPADASLMYATNRSGNWVTEVIDSEVEAQFGTSIAIDSLDRVHIAYHDQYPEKNLKYAHDTLGYWNTHSLDRDGDVGRYPSLAIDSSGEIHISYGDATNGRLRYARTVGGVWRWSTIDRANGHLPSSLAIDASNGIHIGYSQADGGGVFGRSFVRYATNRGR